MSLNYPEQFVAQLKICLDLFDRCGICFFSENRSNFTNYWRSIFIVSFVAVHFVAMSLYTRTLSTDISISKLAYTMSAYLVSAQGILKAVIVVSKKSDIEKLVHSLGAIWRTEFLSQTQTEKREKSMKQLNTVQKIYLWGNIIATLQNLITPLLSSIIQRLQGHDELQLPFGYALPFELDMTRYLGVYVFQFYTIIRVVYVYVASEFLKIIFCAYLSIEFMLLQEDLRTVTLNDAGRADGSAALKALIRRHQVLLELSVLLNKVLNKMVFVDLLFSIMTACLFAFAASVTHNTFDIAAFVLSLLFVMTPIYIYCYYSTVLGEQSSEIGDAVYENFWYQGSMNNKKMVCFIIARSRRPCYLNALNHTPLTVLTFTRVVSTTWSYFSLARKMYSE